jgi:hypothetical protein
MREYRILGWPFRAEARCDGNLGVQLCGRARFLKCGGNLDQGAEEANEDGSQESHGISPDRGSPVYHLCRKKLPGPEVSTPRRELPFAGFDERLRLEWFGPLVAWKRSCEAM